MPRSAAGKAAREQKKLSAAAAWKQGHVGGRGRGKFGGRGGGGGRGGRWGPDGRDARHRETNLDHARASDRANDGDDERDEDDDDLDPLAAIGSGDAYSALLTSLRGGSDDTPDRDYAEALAARDSDAEDSDAEDVDAEDVDEDDEDEREDGSDDANHLEGRSGPTAADASDLDADPGPDAELDDAEPTAGGWDNRDDEADAEDGDEEDAVISDEDDDVGDGGVGEGSPAAAANASTAKHGLATHLRRVVDADVAARLSAAPPKYKRADDDDGGDGGGDATSKSKSKSKSKKTATADASGSVSPGGWWEFDRIAREDGASVRGAPSAPVALPAKLKERWNALRDPASASRAAKRARFDVKAAKGNKVAIEAAKARAAANSAATPPAPFASKTQAEFHALLEQYRDVVYTERAAPGSIPKEPVTDDGLGGGGDDVMDAYLLHAVAHVMRTRQRVTKNNEALLRRAKAAEAELAARRAAERAAVTEAAVASALASGGKEGEGEKAAAARKKPKGGRVKVEDDLPRDQGFVRPTVLILAPMRNVAGRIVRRLLQLCPAAHGRADAVNKLDRFAEDFGAGDSDEEDSGEKERKRKKGLWMPENHAELFRGNTDDHFRLGIKVTKASVRLYVDFFGSDILVASPLGKRPTGGSRFEDRASNSAESPSNISSPRRFFSRATQTVDRRIGRAGDDNRTHRLSPAAVWPNFMFPIGPRLVPSSVPSVANFKPRRIFSRLSRPFLCVLLTCLSSSNRSAQVW